MGNIISTWFNNARSISLPQSLLPATLAIVMASNQGDFSFWMGALAFLGVVFAHLGMNLVDDYFDYQVKDGEVRSKLNSEGMRSRIAKYPYLLDGSATVGDLKLAIFVFGTLAAACGVGVILWRDPLIIAIIALCGLLLGVSYSGFPFRLSFHGLGELVIGVMFGPLLMIGCYYAACGEITSQIVLISIPVGLLVTNIVYSHSVMDALPDAKINKMTFARLLKTDALMIGASAIFNFLPFVIIAVAIIFGKLSPYYSVVVVLLPMAIYLFSSLCSFIKCEKIDLEPKFWMGPMSQWTEIKEAGLEWFMIRWLVARNLISFFCLFLIILNVILKFI